MLQRIARVTFFHQCLTLLKRSDAAVLRPEDCTDFLDFNRLRHHDTTRRESLGHEEEVIAIDPTLAFQLTPDGREVPRGVVHDPDGLRVILETRV